MSFNLTISSTFSAVWRPGSGAQFWVARVPLDEIKVLDQTHFDNGLRLSILQIDSDGPCSAVWHPGTGAQHWQFGMSFDELKAADTAAFAAGRRLVCVDCINGPTSDDGWYAVWRPGTGPQFWRTGLSLDAFKAQDAAFFAQGLRLMHMDHDSGGTETYLGLWRPGSGAQHWLSQTDLAFFTQMNAQREAVGERLVALPPFGLNAIWRSGTGQSPFAFAVDFASFKAKDAELFGQGFRLSDFGVGASLT
jgi:hypothetical protein